MDEVSKWNIEPYFPSASRHPHSVNVEVRFKDGIADE